MISLSLGGSRGEGGGGGGATWTAVQGEGRGCTKCVLLPKEGGRAELGHWMEPYCMQLIVVRYVYATVCTFHGYLHT